MSATLVLPKILTVFLELDDILLLLLLFFSDISAHMHMWKMFIYSGLEWSIRGASIDMNMGNLKIQNVECLRRLLESQTKY